MRKLALLAASALAAVATPALSQTVSYNGNTYNVNDTITIDYLAVHTPGASGTLGLQFTGTTVNGSDTIFNFMWSLENSSDSSQVDGANISGFGFNISGGTLDLGTSFVNTDAPNNGAAAIDSIDSGNISGGDNKLDICFTGNTCAGGADAGPTAGETFTGTLGIEFSSLDSSPGAITLTSPIIRFQNTTPTGSDIGTPGGTPPAPEPATWAMMLVGFGATGFAIRRSRRKTLLTTIA
jgi:hypothetical protein